MEYRVYVIDDVPAVIKVIKSAIGDRCFVNGSTSSREGIEEIKNNHYDLLILDYYIDDMDGADVIEEVKKVKSDIEIVILTGNGSKELSSNILDKYDIAGIFDKGTDIESTVKSLIKIITTKKSNNNDGIANRIKELRRVSGVSQKELATYLNVKRNSIANYEGGVSEPAIDIIKKIADYFGVTTDYLLAYTPTYTPKYKVKNLDKK